MRIIAGKYRSRIIEMPRGRKTRPTQDRVREAVFNIIREIVPGSTVLDLYAGSGAFGIEALSRGALVSLFVDNNSNCVTAIKSNLSVLGALAENAQVLKRDAVRAIEDLKKEGKKFDIIFLDPPYHKDMVKNCLIKIDACDILSKRGFLVAEHHAKDAVPDALLNIVLFKTRHYGDTLISLYRPR